MRTTHELRSIPDDELLRRLGELLHHSRGTEADLVAHIGEVDARRLYAREAAPSMHAYCTERLHLSDAEAYLRIAAARASREHPVVILEMLADGRLHLTAIAKLAPHLTPENRETLLQRATHKTKREVEELLAELEPRPDARALIRKLPERRTPAEGSSAKPPSANLAFGLRLDAVASDRLGGFDAADSGRGSTMASLTGPGLSSHRVAAGPTNGRARPAVIEALAPGRYRVQFTASAGLRDKLERLRALLRSSVPDGDLGAIIEQAVTEKLERLESGRFGRTRSRREAAGVKNVSPSTGGASPAVEQDSAVADESTARARAGSRTTRHIPAAIRRAVYERDGGRCRYEDERGRRCTAREGLEFHHRHPFGLGGDHSIEGISLLCKAHNGYLADVDYGRNAMARRRASRQGALAPTAPPSP
jgi:5-methylcytosine-specific restriction endonuclease McrA